MRINGGLESWSPNRPCPRGYPAQGILRPDLLRIAANKMLPRAILERWKCCDQIPRNRLGYKLSCNYRSQKWSKNNWDELSEAYPLLLRRNPIRNWAILTLSGKKPCIRKNFEYIIAVLFAFSKRWKYKYLPEITPKTIFYGKLRKLISKVHKNCTTQVKF